MEPNPLDALTNELQLSIKGFHQQFATTLIMPVENIRKSLNIACDNAINTVILNQQNIASAIQQSLESYQKLLFISVETIMDSLQNMSSPDLFWNDTFENLDLIIDAIHDTEPTQTNTINIIINNFFPETKVSYSNLGKNLPIDLYLRTIKESFVLLAVYIPSLILPQELSYWSDIIIILAIVYLALYITCDKKI